MKKLFFFIILFFAVESITNSRPIIYSTSFKVKENQTSIGQIDAIDDENDQLSYYVYPEDDVSINENTGVLSFNENPDYEQKRKYVFRVYVSDGKKTTKQRIIVRIKNVNEGPFLTSSSYNFKQDFDASISLQASDPEGNDVTFGLSGKDAGLFQIENNGFLTFKDEPDEARDKTYKLIAELNDGSLSSKNKFTVNLDTEFLIQHDDILTPYEANSYQFGERISTSRNGNFLLVKSFQVNTDTEGDHRGKSRVELFEWKNSQWNRRANIEGGLCEFIAQNQPYNSMDISNDGTIIAFVVTEPDLDASGEYCDHEDWRYDSLTKYIRIFRQHPVTKKWSQDGNDINLGNLRWPALEITDNDLIAVLAEYSEAGKNQIKIYKYNDLKGRWKKTKTPLIVNSWCDASFQSNGCSWTPWTISNNGNLVSINDIYDDLMIYRYKNRSWNAMTISADTTIGSIDSWGLLKFNENNNKIAISGTYYCDDDAPLEPCETFGYDNWPGAALNILKFNYSRQQWELESSLTHISYTDESDKFVSFKHPYVDLSDDFSIVAAGHPCVGQTCKNSSFLTWKIQKTKFKLVEKIYIPETDYDYDYGRWGNGIKISGDGSRVFVPEYTAREDTYVWKNGKKKVGIIIPYDTYLK